MSQVTIIDILTITIINCRENPTFAMLGVTMAKAKMQQRFDNKYRDNVIDHKLGNKQQSDRQMQNNNEENEYTPMPVK